MEPTLKQSGSRGQMTTEFALLFPVMLMIALIACNSIHTFGMRYPIHIAFFDECGNVIAAETSVPPGTKRSCPHAVGVLEMPALYPASQWFISGDSLRLAPPDAYHRT